MIADAYLAGLSTRRVEKLVQQLGVERMSRSQVSELARCSSRSARASHPPARRHALPYLVLDALEVQGPRGRSHRRSRRVRRGPIRRCLGGQQRVLFGNPDPPALDIAFGGVVGGAVGRTRNVTAGQPQPWPLGAQRLDRRARRAPHARLSRFIASNGRTVVCYATQSALSPIARGRSDDIVWQPAQGGAQW